MPFLPALLAAAGGFLGSAGVPAALVSAGGSLIGGALQNKKTTSSSVNYQQMRDAAQAAGFNPLTALRNGGAAGFSTTTAPRLSSGEILNQAVQNGMQTYLAHDPVGQKTRQLENELLQMQIDVYKKPTAGYTRTAFQNPQVSTATSSPVVTQTSKPWHADYNDPSQIGSPLFDPTRRFNTTYNPRGNNTAYDHNGDPIDPDAELFNIVDSGYGWRYGADLIGRNTFGKQNWNDWLYPVETPGTMGADFLAKKKEKERRYIDSQRLAYERWKPSSPYLSN